jgi:hypothetical protein
VGIFAFYWLQKEPTYRGKPVSQWLTELSSTNANTLREAQAALREMGPAAAPWLAGELRKEDSAFRRVAARVGGYFPSTVRRVGHRFFRSDDNFMAKYNAVRALENIGTNGLAAIPELGKLLDGPNDVLSSVAASALAKMGSPAVPVLTNALNSQRFVARANACKALWEMGPPGAAAAPRLNAILTNEVGEILASASFALARIGPASTELLISNLDNTNARARYWSAYALRVSSYLPTNGLPRILGLTKDSDPKIRKEGVALLGGFLVDFPEADAVLLNAIENEVPLVQVSALETASIRRRFVVDHLDIISDALNSPESQVRKQAAILLSRSGRFGASVVPALEQAQQDPEKDVRDAAQNSLEGITASLAAAEKQEH